MGKISPQTKKCVDKHAISRPVSELAKSECTVSAPLPDPAGRARTLRKIDLDFAAQGNPRRPPETFAWPVSMPLKKSVATH